MSEPASNRNAGGRLNVLKPQSSDAISIEICILAGGSSKRMGRDKSRLCIGAKTMLGHIRKAARATGLPVRVIRRDCVPKCGPLSGIYTALKTTRMDAVLFLACDMPFVSTELIQCLLQKVGESVGSQLQPVGRSHADVGFFVQSRGRAGFPFVLPREYIESVERQIQTGDYSLQGLATAIRGTIFPLKHRLSRQLFNVNTPGDLTVIRKKFLNPKVTLLKGRRVNGRLPDCRK